MSDEITSVMVNPLNGFGNLKAIASLNFRGVILKGLKLLDKDGTSWLGMPGRKKNESWEDVYFFPDRSVKESVLDAILKQYNLAQGI
ncbi:MAG: septation protein SpoVG family protein [Vulcanimicrobiota bacterium]